jgi:hypothetical protein
MFQIGMFCVCFDNEIFSSDAQEVVAERFRFFDYSSDRIAGYSNSTPAIHKT